MVLVLRLGALGGREGGREGGRGWRAGVLGEGAGGGGGVVVASGSRGSGSGSGNLHNPFALSTKMILGSPITNTVGNLRSPVAGKKQGHNPPAQPSILLHKPTIHRC